MADFAICVSDDVSGVRVDADQVGRLDVNAGFLLDLPHDRVADGLADVLRTTGDRVEVVVGAPDHEEAALVVLDERGHRDHDVGRLGGVGVVVVIGARHTYLPTTWEAWRRPRRPGSSPRTSRTSPLRTDVAGGARARDQP